MDEIEGIKYYRSLGGGQYFKRIDEFDKLIVCDYNFSLLIEKTRIRDSIFFRLDMEEIDEETFNNARERVSLLLNQL